jgi:hypothetical protein
MPLIQWDDSAARKQAFQTGLLHFSELGRLRRQLAVHPRTQPIHVFGLRDVLARERVMGAPGKPVSWRYFAGVDIEAPVAGDVDVSTPPKVTGMRFGPHVRAALEATQRLEEFAQADNTPWQLRLLRIPGLLTEAFWMTLPDDLAPDNANAKGSLIVLAPYYETFIPGLKQGTSVSIEEFLDKVRPLAATVAKYHDSPGSRETQPRIVPEQIIPEQIIPEQSIPEQNIPKSKGSQPKKKRKGSKKK